MPEALGVGQRGQEEEGWAGGPQENAGIPQPMKSP